MSIKLDEETSLVEETTDPILSHIVEADGDKKNAAVKILEARVNGTPVTALCGYVWVPSRDPQKHPVCQKCLEIFEFAKDLRS